MAKSTRKPEPTPELETGVLVAQRVPRYFGLQITQLAGLALGLIACVVVGAWAFSDSDVPQGQRLKQALRLLDEHRDRSAKAIAEELQSQSYQDPEFAGGVPFTLGVVAFREAAELDPATQEQRYMVAVEFLRDADQCALTADRRPEWAFALGTSLHRLGAADEAAPLLEIAATSYPPGKTEASLMLAETYLFKQSHEDLEAALQHNSAGLSNAALSKSDRDRALLQRAQILLALDRRAESEEVLTKVSSDAAGNQGSIVLRAQTCIRDKRYSEAIQILEPVAADRGLERIYPAQAAYLLGRCAEHLGELENAIAFYERTIERFERTHEALAAQLGAAEAFRKLGRNEEALEAYAAVLRVVRHNRGFRNRWISRTQLQESLLAAWNGWIDRHFYAEAITLAELLNPFIPRDEACELVARANQRWAEHLEADATQLPPDKRSERQEQLRKHWQQSGLAYARLAETRKTSSAYNDALWMSADDFVKGHDFENAVTQLTLFIDARGTALIPTALVRRGQAYLDLDRLDEALRDFQMVVANHPTDPVAFQARYLVGQCYFQQNKLDLAEQAWRKILESPDLTPDALEWQHALYSLSNLLYHSAERSHNRLQLENESPRTTPATPVSLETTERIAFSQARFEEAIRRSEEFLDRYPQAREVAEVRFRLAKALQESAAFPQARLPAAETEIARNELRRQMLDRFERAIAQFEHLQTDLLALQAAGTIDPTGRKMLRNCYFEIAHCRFHLGRYQEAITAYTSAAGNYQLDSDTLTAHVQIANCYDRLKRPAEALSTLAQAQLILNELADTDFPQSPSGMTRTEWQKWLDWAMRLYQ